MTCEDLGETWEGKCNAMAIFIYNKLPMLKISLLLELFFKVTK